MANPLVQQLLSILWSFSSFVVAIIVLVTVHEFGHFWVARKLGVKVLCFSVGFGKPLFSWHDRTGCEYVIAGIPVGGYVKMLDEREAPVPEAELPFSFNRQPIWRRVLIVAAGPAANFLLATIIFWFAFLGGRGGFVPLVGSVAHDSVAEKAGLQAGQEIISVDGVETPTRTAVLEALLARIGETGVLALEVRYPGDNTSYELLVDLHRWLADAQEPDPVAGLGLDFYRPPFVMVSSVIASSPAERAGLHSGDIIERLDNKLVESVDAWLGEVRSRPGQSLVMGVRRDGILLDLPVTPASVVDKQGATIGQIGAQIGSPPLDTQYIRHMDYSVAGALWQGIRETGKQSRFLLLALQKLVVGNLSPKNLSGPLGIAKVAGDSANRGFAEFCYMLAILSINLGIVNLMPVPVLDGGHLLLFLLEAVKGKPVPENIQMFGNQIGFALIVGLMLFAVYNDLIKL